MGESVRLAVLLNEGEAVVLCGLLRAEAIPCFHRVADVAAEALSARGWHEVLVDEADLARSRELLQNLEPLSAECAKCGRPIGEDGRWLSGENGELLSYCTTCAEQEFGPIG